MAMSVAERHELCLIWKRSKGWPVGIPASNKKAAKQLFVDGYLEYAPPAWLYPNPVTTYRLTTSGQLVVKGKIVP